MTDITVIEVLVPAQPAVVEVPVQVTPAVIEVREIGPQGAPGESGNGDDVILNARL